MPPQFPSIQSFFQPQSIQSSPEGKKTASLNLDTRDGFTEHEIDAVVHPTLETWTPGQDYEDCEIGSLIPGPKCITFVGRVVNLHGQCTPSKMPQAAKGCVKLTVKDDTGALTVRLWYAKVDYKICLGHLLTIWAPHVSNGEAGSLAPSTAPLFISIFPERDRSSYIMLHENSDEGVLCKTPLGYAEGHQLSGLMTLKNFLNGGYDVVGGRILVCVKSIGAKKKVTNKKGATSELVNVGVFDDTAEATLTLWGSAAPSAARWKPSFTTLLITNPGPRIYKNGWISLTANTHVDVDPCIDDAHWLRSFAERLTRREHVNPPFPRDVFDTDAAINSEVRVLYTLAEIDEFARAAPGVFMGYLSMIITELNIVSLHRRGMLLCTECCGIHLYANAITAKCKQCDKDTSLALNPRLIQANHLTGKADNALRKVGPLIDETGSISTGKVIWSPEAWEQLLGRTADELVNSSLELMKYLEHRLLFLRLTLVFGWSDKVGKLAVFRVTM